MFSFGIKFISNFDLLMCVQALFLVLFIVKIVEVFVCWLRKKNDNQNQHSE